MHDPYSDSATTPSDPPSLRLPESDLSDLASAVGRMIDDVRHHGVLIDRLAAEPATDPNPERHDVNRRSPADADAGKSAFIVAMGGVQYATELAALTDWVHYLLLPVYGREISTTRPWCARWYEHPEAVARLHGLWLAWQQLTDVEAGPLGPSTWHRDHLDHALAQLRSPDGPFSACTTSPARPAHRLLATPEPEPQPAGDSR